MKAVGIRHPLDTIRPIEQRIWALFREPESAERDETILNNFDEILHMAEREYELHGGPTSSYVDHNLLFSVLVKRRDSTGGRAVVDRLIRLRGGNTPKWIEQDWQKAIEANQLPGNQPTKTQTQALAFQRVLVTSLSMIADWGTRSDALFDSKTALHPFASRWHAGDALVKVFHFIIDESKKPNSRITNIDNAEALVNEIIAVLYDSGMYKMSEKRRWRKVQ